MITIPRTAHTAKGGWTMRQKSSLDEPDSNKSSRWLLLFAPTRTQTNSLSDYSCLPYEYFVRLLRSQSLTRFRSHVESGSWKSIHATTTRTVALWATSRINKNPWLVVRCRSVLPLNSTSSRSIEANLRHVSMTCWTRTLSATCFFHFGDSSPRQGELSNGGEEIPEFILNHAAGEDLVWIKVSFSVLSAPNLDF